MKQRDRIKQLKSEVTLEVAKEWNDKQERTCWFCFFSEMSVNDRGFDTVQNAVEDHIEKVLTENNIEIKESY